MFSLAHDVGDAKQQSGAVGRRSVLPGLESLRRLFDGAIGELFSGFVESSDYLCAISGINTVERVAGGNSFPTDDERIFASKLTLNFFERRAHRLRVFFFSEICKRFVTKFCWHVLSLKVNPQITQKIRVNLWIVNLCKSAP